MMLSVGEYKLGHLDNQTIKMTTAFAGGIGDSRRELCGAFSAGVMIIGALFGRTDNNKEDKECFQIVEKFSERFNQDIGPLNCGELRADLYGSEGKVPCSVLVEQAAEILINVVEQD